MLKLKRFKFQVAGKGLAQSTITGAAAWRGPLHERLLDYYVVMIRILRLAEWNGLDSTLLDRLRSACKSEADNIYQYRLRPFFAQEEFFDLVGRDDLAAEDFIEAIEKNSRRTERYEWELLVEDMYDAKNWNRYFASTVILGALDIMDDPDFGTENAVKFLSDWGAPDYAQTTSTQDSGENSESGTDDEADAQPDADDASGAERMMDALKSVGDAKEEYTYDYLAATEEAKEDIEGGTNNADGV